MSIHIDSKEGALDLITHMPFAGTEIDIDEVAVCAGPCPILLSFEH